MRFATEIRQSIQRLQCSLCGAEVNASCNCGKPYIPAKQRVAEHDAKHPGRSNRATAAALGVDEKTVRKARADQSAPDQEPSVAPATPAKVVGIDGKEYPARRDVTDDKDPEKVKAALINHAGAAFENGRTINYLITRHPESVTREAKKAIRCERRANIRSNGSRRPWNPRILLFLDL
jgi:hypothetical protein